MPESFEHYKLLTAPDGSIIELGHGAMGITYKAFDTNLRCNVALKVINARLLDNDVAAERFLREARGAAQLRHRNVASVFHLGKTAESYFYAMEFIDGETVSELVKRDGPLEPAFALDIAQQVACALIAAERQHLVHRDIKPSNLMLVREGDGEILVKVIDFGLVKSAVMASTAGAAALTATGFVGTPYFASPEQLDGQTEDVRSDIYSLGVTLWFMLTGKPTFVGSVASVIAQQLDKAPPFESLAVLPAQIVAVLRRMLEKEVSRRIQSAAELRTELKACIEILKASQPAPKPREFGAEFETVALSSAHGFGAQPRAGGLLKNRYRLIEDLDPANPGCAFHAEDIVLKKRVAVKIVRADAAVVTRIEQEADRLKCASNPNFIEVREVERDKDFSFVVMEWLEGFPLVELLRARRELTLRETLMLLDQLASAVDAARELNVKAQMNLREVSVHFPDGLEEPSAQVVLRCPFDEWPAFVVKMNPLGSVDETDSSATWDGGQTIIAVEKPAQRNDIAQLGALVCELLGGKPGSNFTPLPNASEEGNAVLKRCLASEFSTAREFYDALAASGGVAPAKREAVKPLPSQSPASTDTESRLLPEQTRTHDRTETASRSTTASPPARKSHTALIVAAITGIVATGGVALWFLSSGPSQPREATSPSATPSAKTTAASAAVPHTPPPSGQPWTNTLDMRFVPLGDIHFAVCETRVSDFKAFVDATGYDAEGGMYSLAQDGFKQHGNSWKNPGFPQTPGHPVVGVNWEDARQFCAWLTRKERGEGTLKAFQVYRLPTDREWSQAIGLTSEQGVTPEDRSGKIKDVYPWGKTAQPPASSGNYAGLEARVGAPETFAGIANYQDNFPRTAPVESQPANAIGIRDLAGNVWEWCDDAFNKTSQWRVLRGGSWATSRTEELLSSCRRGYDPMFRHDDIGFRCVIANDNGNTP